VRARIQVTLKDGVLDPQGVAIQRASASLGYTGVASVRQGKLFEIELEPDDPGRARALLEELCQKLLANPVIEDYEIVSLEP
jgi:phosphoribosylformylglycinamidine synthase PurS subunit